MRLVRGRVVDYEMVTCEGSSWELLEWVVLERKRILSEEVSLGNKKEFWDREACKGSQEEK